MYEPKDSGFTLFGRRIQANSDGLHPQIPLKSEAFLIKDYNIEVAKVAVEGPREDDLAELDKASIFGESEEENQATVRPNEEQTNSGTESSGSEQDKTLKKPDKIIPCPRCNSLDTKFCYFNNYNVNQPRYFCKNCQRYWTAGGTMRNVPVGAGRRKNKHLATQYRQILVSSDGVPASCTIEGPVPGNETVLKFGEEQKRASLVRNGEELSSCVSSMTSSSVPGSELPSNELYVAHPMHCYPTTPWMYPCNPGQYPSQQVNSPNPNEVQFCPGPMLAVPGFYPTSIPLQFVPASYWDCMPLWSAGAGTMPLTGSGGCQSPSPSTSNSCCSGNRSPTLGKHGRDVSFMDGERPEKCIVVPRTLRVDDPDEASRSPIWASLGIKHNQADSLRKGTIFRAFKSKAAANSKGHV